MSVVQVNQIKAQLHKLFDGVIHLSDLQSASLADSESQFLTRALAAYAVATLSGAQPTVAAAHVTDGYGDNGLDAVYFDDAEKRLYVVQSKWVSAANKAPDLGDVHKFVAGARELVSGDLSTFNAKTQALGANIQRALSDTDLRIVLVVVYTSLQPLSVPATKILGNFQDEMNDVSDLVELSTFGLKKIYQALTTAAEGDPIALDVMIAEWGHVESPFEAYYGQVNASDIAKWFDLHGDKLFSRNLRKLIQASDVNKTIADSARQHPNQFWYLNNGITVPCDRLKKEPLGGGDRSSGVFECEGFSVVNGAQTVGSVAAAAKTTPGGVEKARVLVRLISLENCPPTFGEEVTRATNMQNRIESRDFVSLDQEQVRLRQEFVMDGKYYALKTGEPSPLPDQGLTIDEATVALACARPEIQHAIIAKAAVGRFWENLDKAPYKLLFNASLTSLRLWRLVQILRSVDDALKQVPKNDSKTRAAAIHGNRFIAHEVFIRSPLADLDVPSADEAAIVAAAVALVPQIHTATAEALSSKFATSYPGSLFKNAAKCASLADEIKKSVPLPA